jgi:ribosome-binding factor A
VRIVSPALWVPSILLVSEVMSRRKSRPRHGQSQHKTLQLCAQVRDALSWVLGSTIRDDRLTPCQIEAVEPLSGGNRLLVKVVVPPDLNVAEVNDRLAAAAPALRSEVAQSITRRKVPELVYLAVPAR